MKKNVVILGLLIVLIGLISVDSIASSEVASDPLITLSYLEKRIEDFKVYVDSNDTGGTVVNSKFEVINVESGKTVIFTDNSVEFILRRGDATAIGNGDDGLSDLTDGLELGTGDFVQKDHLILVPRNDNRGIVAKTDIWIMIKGTYELR